MDMSLIKIIGDHYYIRRDKIVNKITHRGRLFFDKFERVDAPLNLNVMREHAAKKIVVAHDLITKDNKVKILSLIIMVLMLKDFITVHNLF